jgi:hypothetical protein
MGKVFYYSYPTHKINTFYVSKILNIGTHIIFKKD